VNGWGHALGDVQRMTIQQLLRDQPLTLTEVAEKTGQPRTSVHHHLSVLRESGLIGVGRNADRQYRYTFLPSGFAAALDTARATFPTPH
jgi:DNA-binding transcriptional ArsR family regulator